MTYRPVINASLLGGLLLIGMFSGGCTINYELNTTPISNWPDHERVPASVDLVLSDQLRGYVFEKTSWGGDHFRYPIGNVVAVNSRAMAEAAFAKVIVTDGKSPPPPGVNGILTPEMGLVDRSESAFAFDPVDMTADVKWTMSDPHGQVLWIKTVRGTAKHDLSNVFGHTAAAREHVDLVMQDLFTKSLKEITTAPDVRGLAGRYHAGAYGP
jgi:hypothetical protein